MAEIKIKCPAKINLTLEVLNRREDGFHNINSIMQTVSLYDFLSVKTEKSNSGEILLDGNSTEIPYNHQNLVYKAADLFMKKTEITARTAVYIEKNIPVSAGLAGGSTDAAGTLFGLNELFERPLNREELHELCAVLGSDLNVCLTGGCLFTASRGEKIQKLKTADYPVTLIKPKKLGISAKEAYTKYDEKKRSPKLNMTKKMSAALQSGFDIREFLYNDLEYAVFEDYKELQNIKSQCPNAVMTGSGSAYFILEDTDVSLGQEYSVIRGLRFIPSGVSCCK